MANEPLFACSDCGSTVLAISHTWTEEKDLEEVGTVQEDGRYAFEKKVQLDQRDGNHEWVAYCGGCGHGVTLEWIAEDRVRVLVQETE